ncbi:DUF3726 domain-containing protein [Yoonia sp. SS1-5]|uniref:DUF3726 domain-containing protein n=1 Tax=Yoonia rhodophyticola TaxID=3137370 RepID=A0AAN0MAX7_9RHOB
MMRSLNEVTALVLKAGLGAGLPVGQAEDLARTASHLVTQNGDLRVILDAISEPNAPIDVAWGGDKLAVKAGNAAMTAPIVKDGFATGVTKARLAQTSHAPLVLAMLAAAGLDARADGPLITRTGNIPAKPGNGPVEIADEVWDALQVFAARTYVKASDASRAAGAGAGLTDND